MPRSAVLLPVLVAIASPACHLVFDHAPATAGIDLSPPDRGSIDRRGDRAVDLSLGGEAGDARADSAPGPVVQVTTIAGGSYGGADGPALQATFQHPANLVHDEAGALGFAGALYISEEEGHRVRRLLGGQVELVAGSKSGYLDGAGAAARFNAPTGLAIHGSELFVADLGNHRVRTIRFHPGAGSYVVGTAAGTGNPGWQDGVALTARLNAPHDLAVGAGGELLIAEYQGHHIRSLLGGMVSTAIGKNAGSSDGPAASASLNQPVGLVLDTSPAAGPVLYIAEHVGRVRALDANGQVSTVCSGLGAAEDVVATPRGIFVADWTKHVILRVQADGSTVAIAGQPGKAGFADGPGTSARFNGPHGIIAITGASTGKTSLLVADYSNDRIRKLELP